MNGYIYIKDWVRGKSDTQNLLTPEEALQIHNNKGRYAVIVDTGVRPDTCIEIDLNKSYICVWRFNKHFRLYFHYFFSYKKKRQQYFLSTAVHRAYVQDYQPNLANSRVAWAIAHLYDEKYGSLQIVNEGFWPSYFKNSTDLHGINLADHFIDVPQFGDYEAILKPRELNHLLSKKIDILDDEANLFKRMG